MFHPSTNDRGWVFRISYFRAAVDPGGQGFDLLFAEGTIVGEVVLRIGEPGRHFLGNDVFANGFRPRPRILVREQGEGRDLAGTVALLAMFLPDRGSVLMMRDRGRRGYAGRACEASPRISVGLHFHEVVLERK
jgi:hypothetical protein